MCHSVRLIQSAHGPTVYREGQKRLLSSPKIVDCLVESLKFGTDYHKHESVAYCLGMLLSAYGLCLDSKAAHVGPTDSREGTARLMESMNVVDNLVALIGRRVTEDCTRYATFCLGELSCELRICVLKKLAHPEAGSAEGTIQLLDNDKAADILFGLVENGTSACEGTAAVCLTRMTCGSCCLISPVC